MPNFVRNNIKVLGKETKSVMQQYLTEENNLDFDKVIATPEGFNKELERGSGEDEAIITYLTEQGISNQEIIKICNTLSGSYYDEEKINAVKEYIKKNKNIKELCEKGEQYLKNYEVSGFLDWYEWNVFNWGTKWNAAETHIDNDGITFYTAWAFPVPIVTRISKDNPESILEVTFEDEDTGCNFGKIYYKAGHEIASVYVGINNLSVTSKSEQFEIDKRKVKNPKYCFPKNDDSWDKVIAYIKDINSLADIVFKNNSIQQVKKILLEEGQEFYTPRFCNVKITDIYESEEELLEAGFKEPTYYSGDDYIIRGKSVGYNQMIFAAAKKGR